MDIIHIDPFKKYQDFNEGLQETIKMISGFSEQLLKIFMNYDDFNPLLIVEDILTQYIKDIIIDDKEKEK
jgi:hypothetical protein